MKKATSSVMMTKEFRVIVYHVCEIFDQGTLPCGENMLDGRSEEDLLDLQKREAELWKRESDQGLSTQGLDFSFKMMQEIMTSSQMSIPAFTHLNKRAGILQNPYSCMYTLIICLN